MAIQHKKDIIAQNVTTKGNKKTQRRNLKQSLKKVVEAFNHPSYPFAGGTPEW